MHSGVRCVLTAAGLLNDPITGRKRGIDSLRHAYATLLVLSGRVSRAGLGANMGNSLPLIDRHYYHFAPKKVAGGGMLGPRLLDLAGAGSQRGTRGSPRPEAGRCGPRHSADRLRRGRRVIGGCRARRRRAIARPRADLHQLRRLSRLDAARRP